MPQQQYDYDLFTIGGGSGGVRAARFAAQYGARVALAEKRDLGGTCVNVGCIPKKLMSYAAHYHGDLQEAAPYGWTIDNPRFDWATLIANKDREIARLNGVYRKLLDDTGVTLFQGHATIVDAHTVAVGEQRITARHILIATGGRPMRPDVPGGELGIVSDDFFHLPALPQNAIVVGGGYIAVELASILNGLGSKVTLVHRSAQLLRGMDADLGVFLAKEMEKKGITVRLDMQIASITAQGGTNEEKKRVTLKNGDTIDADCILFATGRQPNVEGMGLDEAGVQRDERGAVVVDADFRTSVPSIHAVGDVIDRVALTPVALAEGMVVASALFGDGKRAV
ncbi:MAG TPA: FAD-dependent oxidoreductase, partial [Oxalicibacterium sp.]|nr:FAD-dependent oxidoreductase [Oxalicibacterium sp.]